MTSCRACRLDKCLLEGMDPTMVKAEQSADLSQFIQTLYKRREFLQQKLKEKEEKICHMDTVAVSAHWLMSVSPVISRMLSVEMREKQQRMITLDELGVDMDQFMEFLEAITYLTMNKPFLPNPTNVLMLLKLADYFQVPALKSRCETHLINCVEIPLIDRFLLIERFGLDNFKYYFLDFDVIKLRAFFNANHAQVFPVISKEFFGELFLRVCG
ncbi:hypothetical protein niasHT_005995 [Heterodera trifolii]|uniref:BTB domain-containing protein n=1 Tax=Heterodera trifolii TaxID=157864 RepID=A0ABD2LWU8_9BILA